mgnify:CR=1 FL=1
MEKVVFERKSDKVPEVYCKSRKKPMMLVDCMDSFVDANAIPNRRSACFRCLQGQRTRTAYASS